jgi:hypothetical protein
MLQRMSGLAVVITRVEALVGHHSTPSRCTSAKSYQIDPMPEKNNRANKPNLPGFGQSRSHFQRNHPTGANPSRARKAKTPPARRDCRIMASATAMIRFALMVQNFDPIAPPVSP